MEKSGSFSKASALGISATMGWVVVCLNEGLWMGCSHHLDRDSQGKSRVYRTRWLIRASLESSVL